MSLAEIKKEVLALPADEQAELASFLSARLRRDDPGYRELLKNLIDDRNQDNWVSWDDAKKTLDQLR